MLGFRPTLWPTLITIPALAILLALGTWQLQRLEWKTALIAEREAALQAPPVALPDDPAALRQMDFRRIRVSGEFLHDRSLLLSARSYQGRPGSHLLTPLRLETGRVLMVNRGWIPLDATPSSPAIARPEGAVEVSGILRAGRRKGWLTPESVPEKGQWFWYDLSLMADHLGLMLLPAVLEADAAPDPAGLPVGGQTQVRLSNNHLQYALTWYGLAVALVVIYVVFHRQRDRDDVASNGSDD